jgi:hypothetical protein
MIQLDQLAKHPRLQEFLGRIRGAGRFPSPTLQPPDGLELLITDSPVWQYENRNILDRARLEFGRYNQWRSVKLTGEKPEHEFLIKSRQTPWFSEIQLRVILHGDLRNTLIMRHRADLRVSRLWLSRGYTHEDFGRQCFAQREPPEEFKGDLWFATLKPGTADALQQDNYRFEHGETASGRVRLDLHSGYSYALDWKAHRDGYGRDYTTRWFRSGELLAETLESVYRMKGALASGCAALRMASYCDTDDI